jgi:branched-chain amino acid transport system permease protein
VLPQLIANGLIAGSIYALMAAGFSLMYALQRFMNIAHGASYVAGAFAAYATAAIGGQSLLLAFPVGIAVAMLVSLGTNLLVFEPLQRQKEKTYALLMASFGVFLLVEAFVLILFGANVKTFGLPIRQGIAVAGAIVTPVQLVILATAPVVFAGLWIVLYRSKVGTALRATADHETIAKTMGVNVRAMRVVTALLGGALGGLAGILVGLEQNIEHTMGLTAVLKGLTAAVIGGIGNVPAAILGGYLLGLAENLGIWYLPSGYKDAIAFVLLIAFLLVRPHGFFGDRRREEAGG